MNKRQPTNGRFGLSLGSFVLGAIIGAAVLFLYLHYNKPAPITAPPPSTKAPEATEKAEEAPVVERRETGETPLPAPMVAIVIDDMGGDMGKLRELIGVGSPITFAVLPNLGLSEEVAEEAHKKGYEVIMHLPMEPKDISAHDPGEGALLTNMTEKEVRDGFEQNLRSVPHAVGVNNHMGSRFTENEALMRAVLVAVRGKELFFLDSKTTPDSVAKTLASEMGIKTEDRDVFLDNVQDAAYVKAQLQAAVKIARKRGSAIAIGHPYPETIEALKKTVPELRRSGIDVVSLSHVLK
ncbi:MAG: divergent polysaccharide deacetylase family protein [Deltaproteobacteria bacterium]